MLPNGVFHFSDFLTSMNRHPDLKRGCLVDTSVLFAYAYPNDRFSESAAQLFDFLGEIEVPVFTNVNIRSEFINKYFEVLVPEGLNDLYQLSGLRFSEELRAKLASNYATINTARKTGASYKFNSNKIDEWRKLLRRDNQTLDDGWFYFCSSSIGKFLGSAWDATCKQAGVNFLSLRGTDAKEWMNGPIEWQGMVDIVGDFGIGSSDAMIVNLFVNSHFDGIFTADLEMARVISKISGGKKFVFVPGR